MRLFSKNGQGLILLIASYPGARKEGISDGPRPYLLIAGYAGAQYKDMLVSDGQRPYLLIAGCAGTRKEEISNGQRPSLLIDSSSEAQNTYAS